jgi:capsule polysaccharide export protein KpsC/LpsZ
VKWRLSELLDDIGFELLLMLRKVMFGLAVFAGWMLVLSAVILWLGGLG